MISYDISGGWTPLWAYEYTHDAEYVRTYAKYFVSFGTFFRLFVLLVVLGTAFIVGHYGFLIWLMAVLILAFLIMLVTPIPAALTLHRFLRLNRKYGLPDSFERRVAFYGEYLIWTTEWTSVRVSYKSLFIAEDSDSKMILTQKKSVYVIDKSQCPDEVCDKIRSLARKKKKK